MKRSLDKQKQIKPTFQSVINNIIINKRDNKKTSIYNKHRLNEARSHLLSTYLCVCDDSLCFIRVDLRRTLISQSEISFTIKFNWIFIHTEFPYRINAWNPVHHWTNFEFKRFRFFPQMRIQFYECLLFIRV